jgi:hypothetical protein
LRSLFRFLFWSGKTKRDLASSLPRVATGRASHLPRSLKPEEIGRLIDAVSAPDAIGRRNYAMLMILARLRAPDDAMSSPAIAPKRRLVAGVFTLIRGENAVKGVGDRGLGTMPCLQKQMQGDGIGPHDGISFLAGWSGRRSGAWIERRTACCQASGPLKRRRRRG